MSPDDRVEFPGTGGCGQVNTQLVQSRGTAGAAGKPGPGCALGKDVGNFSTYPLESDTKAVQHTGGYPFPLA